MTGFVTPIRVNVPLTTHSKSTCKQRVVCVLEEPARLSVPRTPSSPPSTEPVPAVVQDKSKYYHVIQPDEDPSTLPPAPPVHRSIPYVGYLLEDYLGMSTPATRAKKYNQLYKSNFFFNEFVYVTKLEAMNDVLRDTNVFSSNIDLFKFSFFIGPDSLLFMDGPPHYAERNKIAPAFSPSMFSLYFQGIRDTAEQTWERLSNMSYKKPFKLDPELRKFYAAVTIQLTTGLNADSELVDRVRILFTTMIDGLIGPAFGPLWNRTVRVRKEMVDILTNVIKEKLMNEADNIERIRADLREHNTLLNVKSLLKDGADILQVLLAGSNFKTGPNQNYDAAEFEKLVNTMLLLWLAGFFTTAATTSCAMFELGKDKEITRRLVEEQNEVVKKFGITRLEYDQLDSMPLLDSYITEIMRLFPAGNGIIRNVEKDVVLLGKTVKKGSCVIMDLQAAMRDEALYPNANEVVVDRFIEKNDGSKAPPRILAFGGKGSPHFCIGSALAKMMLRTNLAVFLRGYKFELDPNQTQRYRQIPDYTPASEILVSSLDRRS